MKSINLRRKSLVPMDLKFVCWVIFKLLNPPGTQLLWIRLNSVSDTSFFSLYHLCLHGTTLVSFLFNLPLSINHPMLTHFPSLFSYFRTLISVKVHFHSSHHGNLQPLTGKPMTMMQFFRYKIGKLPFQVF